ncbi:DUF4956 domain-containing protein [Georgenia wangjunii]|uniref:DUF4956 domain-containing protein n=1 Tax=Georgenia wangjunii TaxID=3117730 RepID=UPI003D9C0CC0
MADCSRQIFSTHSGASTVPNLLLILADVVAVALLTFALYLPRHRRRDLAVAYLGVNVGVLAVAAALSSSTVGAGLGLGLFGVLSIIRLRSTELSQREVAYYFSALALGLLGGLDVTSAPVSMGFMALIVAVMFLGDHPRLLPGLRQETVLLDRAVARQDELTARLEELLGGRVHSTTVQRLDLVNDSTLVDVRYSADGRAPRRRRWAPQSSGAAVSGSGPTPSGAASSGPTPSSASAGGPTPSAASGSGPTPSPAAGIGRAPSAASGGGPATSATSARRVGVRAGDDVARAGHTSGAR